MKAIINLSEIINPYEINKIIKNKKNIIKTQLLKILIVNQIFYEVKNNSLTNSILDYLNF